MKRKREAKRNKRQIALDFLKNLPSGRKIYYRFGNLMVEVTKEEALQLLKEGEEQNSSPPQKQGGES